jgi:hypothetical protein
MRKNRKKPDQGDGPGPANASGAQGGGRCASPGALQTTQSPCDLAIRFALLVRFNPEQHPLSHRGAVLASDLRAGEDVVGHGGSPENV